jgi:hypothetical protein
VAPVGNGRDGISIWWRIPLRPNDGAATILVIVGGGAFSLSIAPAEYSATAEIQADAKAASS